ncbi:MAG: hypothetical protein U0V75_00175 [Ferruginibacter sp.]
MKTQTHRQEHHLHPEFEVMYQKLQEEETINAEISGRQDGLLNKPQSRRHYQIQFRSYINSAIQKAMDFNYSIFKPNSSMATIKELRATAEKLIAELIKKINTVEKEILFRKSDVANLKVNLTTAVLKVIIPVMFGLAEGCLLFTVLSNGGYGLLMITALSFLIALCTGIGLHIGGLYITDAPTAAVKRIRRAIVLSIALIVAVALGMWRALITTETVAISNQVSLQNSSSQSFAMTMFPFIAISFTSFLVGLALEQRFALSKEERKRIKKYREKKAELSVAVKEYEGLTNEKKTIEDKVQEESAHVISQQETAHANELKLLSLAELIRSKYEAANVEHRPDNDCPDFFGQSLQHEFTLYFDHLFQQQNKQK